MDNWIFFQVFFVLLKAKFLLLLYGKFVKYKVSPKYYADTKSQKTMIELQGNVDLIFWAVKLVGKILTFARLVKFWTTVWKFFGVTKF